VSAIPSARIAGVAGATPSPAVTALLAALGGLRVHDASPPIAPDMPMFFLYEGPQIERLFSHAQAGAAANRIALSEHTGTHVDAPFHFDPAGPTVDQLPADVLLLRPYKKFDLSAAAPAAGQQFGAADLEAAAARAGFVLAPGDVAIIEMGWDGHLETDGGAWWGANQPGLDDSACRYLVEAGVVAVASDTAACDVACADGQISSGPGHSTWFLPRGILIVEALRGLAAVAPTGLLVALPLKIAGGTGSPLRVLLLDEGAP
jgi:kynurenine formamidase